LDWLPSRQEAVERKLSRKHLQDGSPVLYDVTSTYFDGRSCPPAKLGHNRNGKKGKLRIVIGLPCDSKGSPAAVEVFVGNTGDPSMLSVRIEKLRTSEWRF
jgi:transposase